MAVQVLVTGAHGFLGRHVARWFARAGHSVTGIGHGVWPVEEWQSWGLTAWHSVDVNLQMLCLHGGEPDIIVDCAGSGSVSFSIEQPLEDFERTVVSTAHVLEFVRLYVPSCRVVYPSSAGIYGIAAVVPIPEDAPAAPISQYGTHKWMAEQMVSSYAQQFKLRAAVVRLFSVYGCGLRKQLLWEACRKFANSDPLFMGTGCEVRDWLHVEDAAELLGVAAGHASPSCPVANGGTGEGASVRDVLTHLSECLEGVPYPVFSGTSRRGDPSRYIAKIPKASSWGWVPTRPWRDGVAEYSRWWKENCQAK